MFIAAWPTAADAKLSTAQWRKVQSEFNEVFQVPGQAAEKTALVERMIEDGTSRAWRLLAEALAKEAQICGDLDRRAAAPNAPAEVLKAAKREQEVLEALVRGVAGAPEAAFKYAFTRANAAPSWRPRAAAVRVAAITADLGASRKFLEAVLRSDRAWQVRWAGLDALGAVDEARESLVFGRLADSSWTVVSRAVQLIEEQKLKRAVPFLIYALPSVNAAVQESVIRALGRLTGDSSPSGVGGWVTWWKHHVEDYDAALVAQAKALPHPTVWFFGTPIRSSRVLFIIDVSGSMKLKAKNDKRKEPWKPPPPVGPGVPPPPEEILSGPKIDLVKHELKKAVRMLPRDSTFNLICFNQGAAAWQKEMMKATAKNKASAYQWIRARRPNGSTYIDGALRMGFTIAGLVGKDQLGPDLPVDTIVLLSDGAPTDSSFPVSKLMDPEVILEHIREWNKDRQVVIHCIGVGADGMEFLRKLAAQNGGSYVDR